MWNNPFNSGQATVNNLNPGGFPGNNFTIGCASTGGSWFTGWTAPTGQPMFPLLFITVACGAISGFHALVAGGTSSKQLAAEQQARTVGYGGMLLEGMLAILVLVAIGSSLTFSDYLNTVWPASGAGNPILGFALAAGNLFHNAFGMSLALGSVLGILLVEGFLITTLDSAVRLNRYLFEALWKAVFANPPTFLRRFWFNAGLSVACMLLLAWNQGYKLIWPLFGSTNQLLAALTLIAVTLWLHRAGKKSWFTLGPALVMIATTVAALVYKLVTDYLPNGNYVLAATDALLLALAVGVVGLSIREFLPGQAQPRPSGVS